MARRRTSRKKTRRTSKRGFNILNAAELYLQTGIYTTSLFAATPIQFLTGRTTGMGTKMQSGRPTDVWQSNQYRPSFDGTTITLPELFGVDGPMSTVAFGTNDALMPQIQTNLAAYGGIPKVVVQSVLLKAGFTIGKKMMSKQRNILNKGIKVMGLKGTVSV